LSALRAPVLDLGGVKAIVPTIFPACLAGEKNRPTAAAIRNLLEGIAEHCDDIKEMPLEMPSLQRAGTDE